MADHLDRWHKDWKDKGLHVVQVELGRAGDQGVTSRTALESWIEERRTEHPVLYDATGAVTERYGVTGFPTAWIVDRRGRVAWTGYPHADPGAVEGVLRRLLGR